jgi:hypothetical protein
LSDRWVCDERLERGGQVVDGLAEVVRCGQFRPDIKEE